MTGYELMMKLYPEWYPENPFHILLKIFLAIAVMLIIPYIYIKVFENRIKTVLKKIRPPRWHLQSLYSI
jgi:hypothetical protein